MDSLYLPNTHLPPEILHQIIRWLDPISLIALSQTSRSWRALINPLPHDFTQRLLALELQPEHGGLVPYWDEEYSRISPPWMSDDLWKTIRYACCGCMKLLPHMMFDKPAFLRRTLRKPTVTPKSEQAERMALTDWEPLEPRVRQIRIHQRAFREKQERQKWVEMARDYNEPKMATAGDPSTRPPARRDEAADLATMYLDGTARHKRRCVECQYHRGHWPVNPTTYSGTKVPIIAVSRRCGMLEPHEQKFPGLLPTMSSGAVFRAPPYWRARNYSYQSIIRCHGCGVWQYRGAFRRWPLDESGQRVSDLAPEEGVLFCNGCLLRIYKDPATLARELNRELAEMLRQSLHICRMSLGWGWTMVYEDFHITILTERPRGLFLRQYEAVGHEILDRLRWEIWDPVEPGCRRALVEDSLLPDLRRRLLRYKKFCYSDVPKERRGWRYAAPNIAVDGWIHKYDVLEESYREIKRLIAFVESNPTLVFDYVMEKEP